MEKFLPIWFLKLWLIEFLNYYLEINLFHNKGIFIFWWWPIFLEIYFTIPKLYRVKMWKVSLWAPKRDHSSLLVGLKTSVTTLFVSHKHCPRSIKVGALRQRRGKKTMFYYGAIIQLKAKTKRTSRRRVILIRQRYAFTFTFKNTK